ncbi:MAG: hypothetical protein CMG57_02915 [Candidatus Marinimicrobia bacterium]|nr:hypothetical protein [Candidatus Neomarinimicrobiota bacterium]
MIWIHHLLLVIHDYGNQSKDYLECINFFIVFFIIFLIWLRLVSPNGNDKAILFLAESSQFILK